MFTPSEHRLLRITDKVVDGIVVNCEAIRRHLIIDEGLAADHIHLCYNGLDTAAFFPAPGPRPAIFDGASAVIGTVASSVPRRVFRRYSKLLRRVRLERPGIRLLVVGSGPSGSSWTISRVRSGVAADVHFEPATPDVARWLNATDIFVLPSFSEALSNSLMEAMACGVASVASRVGGSPDSYGKEKRVFVPCRGC